MQLMSLDRESVLEAGFVLLAAGFVAGLGLLAAGFVAGLGLLVGGRLAGRMQRHQRHAEAAPSPGSIPAERHQQLSTSAR